GGKDPGARGPSGTREKDVVLKISKRLAQIIDADPNMRAYLTRSSDRFVNLRDRMERSRSVEADLFISIHADAFRDPKVSGATVYVLSSKGASDEAARRLADRENAALIGGVDLVTKESTLAGVLLDLSQNASLSASIDIGDGILRNINQITKVRKKRVQQAPFLVLKSPDVPSVLIETAFISNPQDEKNLASPRYREQLSRAIFNGIEGYFVANPPAGTTLALNQARQPTRNLELQHVIRSGETLSTIANRYDVSVRRIRSANRLSGDKIVVGKVLRIPATQDI
ncbi:MAG: N-acetylmuramoyl-L-alanine amidase, partial [Gammaproteobacteria bacterium]